MYPKRSVCDMCLCEVTYQVTVTFFWSQIFEHASNAGGYYILLAGTSVTAGLDSPDNIYTRARDFKKYCINN